MLKTQESAENYLETILILTERSGAVRSVDIAEELGFSKPSVSNAMKRLRVAGQIFTDKNGLIVLTDSGKKAATAIYERHCLLSRYLMALGVSEQTAREDACRIEHVISQESFERLRAHCEGKETSYPKPTL